MFLFDKFMIDFQNNQRVHLVFEDCMANKKLNETNKKQENVYHFNLYLNYY